MNQAFYGFLSNRCTAALLSPVGVVEWLAWPRFDGEAVFCRLLDEAQGGFFSTLPFSPLIAHYQCYRPGTLILETTLETAEGVAHLTDFLPIGRHAYRRRIATDIPLLLCCHPTFGFGYAAASYELTESGALFHHPAGVEAVVLAMRGDTRKLGERDAWRVGPGHVEIELRYGAEWGQEKGELSLPLEDGDALEAVTARYWKGALLRYDGPWKEWFDRSILTIRGLSYRTNGALLASATTSLPEAVGETRQWDYRFVWVRDGAYGAEALLLAGDPVACRQYLEFMFNLVDLVGKPYPSPFVRVDGSRAHGERELLWLSGYRGSRPVRVGNAASHQVQMDLEGELLWLLLMYWRMTGDRTLIRDYWWVVDTLVEWLTQHWNDPDASLWEFRGPPDVYTHSQVLCWVGIGAGIALAGEVLNRRDLVRRWKDSQRRVRDHIMASQRASGESFYTQSARSAVVDAALLTLPLYGFVRVDDPLFLGTLRAIEDQLVVDGTVFRYRTDQLGPVRHPFTLAGFWLARVYLRLGEFDKADRLIQRQLELSTDLRLFAEHVDPLSGEPHGNFPQLFPHAGLVTTLVERARLRRGEPLPKGL